MSDHDVRYPPIADYGMLGDLRSAALLSKQGSIDWMCLPRFDSPWVFGRLLDWDKGGYLELRPVVGELGSRQYPPRSHVIPTVGPSGAARVPGGAVLLHYMDRGGKAPPSISLDDAHTYLHQTDDYWMAWLRSSTYHGRFDEPVHRSALALKLMQYLPTGAFVAAPTTSLPESLGGSLNWDYRYTWIRDTADLVNALHQLGFEDEVDGFLRWVRLAHDRHPEHF